MLRHIRRSYKSREKNIRVYEDMAPRFILEDFFAKLKFSRKPTPAKTLTLTKSSRIMFRSLPGLSS